MSTLRAKRWAKKKKVFTSLSSTILILPRPSPCRSNLQNKGRSPSPSPPVESLHLSHLPPYPTLRSSKKNTADKNTQRRSITNLSTPTLTYFLRFLSNTLIMESPSIPCTSSPSKTPAPAMVGFWNLIIVWLKVYRRSVPSGTTSFFAYSPGAAPYLHPP